MLTETDLARLRALEQRWRHEYDATGMLPWEVARECARQLATVLSGLERNEVMPSDPTATTGAKVDGGDSTGSAEIANTVAPVTEDQRAGIPAAVESPSSDAVHVATSIPQSSEWIRSAFVESPSSREAEKDDPRRGAVPRLLSDDVVSLGKHCAVWLTGDADSTGGVANCIQAFMAIEECIRLGQEANDRALRLERERDEARRATTELSAALLSAEADLTALRDGLATLPQLSSETVEYHHRQMRGPNETWVEWAKVVALLEPKA